MGIVTRHPALHRTGYSNVYCIQRTVSYKLGNVTREGISPIARAVHTTTWAVLYRVFFSREIYAVDDNELVIPWIPCRWDFRLHACPLQGRSRRDRSFLLHVDRFLRYRGIKTVLSRSIRSRWFQLLDRTRILSPSPFLRNDRMINTSAVRDDFRRASINEGQICALYSRLYTEKKNWLHQLNLYCS